MRMSDETVENIRRMYATGLYSKEALRILFRTDMRTISGILSHKRWKFFHDRTR